MRTAASRAAAMAERDALKERMKDLRRAQTAARAATTISGVIGVACLLLCAGAGAFAGLVAANVVGARPATAVIVGITAGLTALGAYGSGLVHAAAIRAAEDLRRAEREKGEAAVAASLAASLAGIVARVGEAETDTGSDDGGIH